MSDERFPGVDDDAVRAEVERIGAAVREAARGLPVDMEPAHHALWFERLAATDAGHAGRSPDAALAGAAGTVRGIANGEVSSVAAVETCLAGLDGIGRSLEAVVGLDRERALEEARRHDAQRAAGHARGPLHGVPLAHKDMFFRAGRPTECGSRIMAGFRPDVTATALERLDAAGAVDVGRLVMGEFAIGAMGHNPVGGTPRNPWNPAHLAGGTSGGPAAAVAAGLVPAALGSDTGGSVRLPAAFCGVVGFKPGYGRISRAGLFPASPTLDHVGVLARTVGDAALVCNAIAGRDPRDPTTDTGDDAVLPTGRDVAGLRLGVPRASFEGLAPDARRAMDDAVAALVALGMRPVEVDLPGADIASPLASLVIMVEAAIVHRHWLAERPQDYAPGTLARLATGARYRAADYRLALMLRADLLRRLGETVFDRADLIVTPTVDIAAPRIDGGDLPAGTGFADLTGPIGRHVRLFNITGLPALALPAGRAANGLPLSIQLVARPRGEAGLLDAGMAYERALGGFARPSSSGAIQEEGQTT